LIATVIDDDDDVRDSVRALLESYGHKVNEYSSAEEYLRQPKGKPDCFVVHHHMPGMTGLELLEHLRMEGDRTPAIVLTGYKNPKMAGHAERIGVKVLEKPTIAEQLLSWMDDACGTCA
jgi:FixJ family two-component response regulator